MISLNPNDNSYFNPQSKVNQNEKNQIIEKIDPENLPDLKFFDLYQSRRSISSVFEKFGSNKRNINI